MRGIQSGLVRGTGSDVMYLSVTKESSYSCCVQTKAEDALNTAQRPPALTFGSRINIV